MPLLELAAAAALATAFPVVSPSPRLAQHVVTVALVVVLLDGGASLGLRRLRPQLVPVVVVGLLGTLLTAAAAAVVARLALIVSWYLSVLVGAAVAPTDPAVVFSVLGHRATTTGTGVALAGESGANDPVGIALLASLLAAGGLGVGAAGYAAGEFALQLAVGTAVGVVGGRLLQLLLPRAAGVAAVVRTVVVLAAALGLYAVGTAAQGSGFLAVFVAGIVAGDGAVPLLATEDRVTTALTALAEPAAFVALGLTVDLGRLTRERVWLPGLLLVAVMTVVIRPAVVAACLARSRLSVRERAFVAFAGLKGAVPLLLGSRFVTAHVAHGQRLYGVVVVVVAVSVLVQGGLVHRVARLLRLPG